MNTVQTIINTLLENTKATSIHVSEYGDMHKIVIRWLDSGIDYDYTDLISKRITSLELGPKLMDVAYYANEFYENRHSADAQATRQFLKPDKTFKSNKEPTRKELMSKTFEAAYGQDMKFDQDKPMMDLIFDDFPDALLAVGECATFGASKYEAHSWKKVLGGKRRYRAAGIRHTIHGESNDKESGLKHAAHAAWNALAYLQLVIDEQK